MIRQLVRLGQLETENVLLGETALSKNCFLA